MMMLITGTSNRDKLGGGGADEMSLMCAMDVSFCSHNGLWVQVINLTRSF